MLRNGFILLFTLAFLTGCIYENKRKNPVPCVPEEVSYSQDLTQYLDDYGCVGCHNDQFASGGVNLLGYDNLKQQVDQGVFLKSIRHESGVQPMPQGSDKMEPCAIKKFEKWISNGAPEN